ncbi:GNAT family N-acetyltransferase [Spongiivirga sp. MCCC 1A20706]|uniref:GNAT family N-acetyltransferase n=1 Tax=Spongiivirga sp. MCCC 1A20706 TaxID=3160963 RepID=UPI003977502C
MKRVQIVVASKDHLDFAEEICQVMANSAKVRGTGIAKRSPDYIHTKMNNGNAVIAISDEGKFAGFCYIEVWGHQKYVANSGLIVHPDFRNMGLARKIKAAIFKLSKKKFPESKIFGITTGLAVMKINSDLGYKPVTFSELTDDKKFWQGCQTCSNYDILKSKQHKMCLCTGMLYDPKNGKNGKRKWFNTKLLKRLKQIKQSILLKNNNQKQWTKLL